MFGWPLNFVLPEAKYLCCFWQSCRGCDSSVDLGHAAPEPKLGQLKITSNKIRAESKCVDVKNAYGNSGDCHPVWKWTATKGSNMRWWRSLRPRCYGILDLRRPNLDAEAAAEDFSSS